MVANVDGGFYPMGPGAQEQIVELLGRQVASPVQFVAGLRTLHDAGARVFVEVGPKRALWGFAADVLGDDAVSLYTNHPKLGDLRSFNHALCGLYAAGLGAGRAPIAPAASTAPAAVSTPPLPGGAAKSPSRDRRGHAPRHSSMTPTASSGGCSPDVIERGRALLGEGEAAATPSRS